MEIHQLKDKISFSGYTEFGKFWVINFAERQIVATGHLGELCHSVLILYHSPEGEGCEDRQASISMLHCQVNIENRPSYY